MVFNDSICVNLKEGGKEYRFYFTPKSAVTFVGLVKTYFSHGQSPPPQAFNMRKMGTGVYYPFDAKEVYEAACALYGKSEVDSARS